MMFSTFSRFLFYSKCTRKYSFLMTQLIVGLPKPRYLERLGLSNRCHGKCYVIVSTSQPSIWTYIDLGNKRFIRVREEFNQSWAVMISSRLEAKSSLLAKVNVATITKIITAESNGISSPETILRISCAGLVTLSYFYRKARTTAPPCIVDVNFYFFKWG